MLNGLYETSPDVKIKERTQVSYSLENTVNKAFTRAWDRWVSVETDHEIIKPYRRFTGGKIKREDIESLKTFFNAYADGLIADKKRAIEHIKERFTHDFDKNHIIADPKAVCTMLQEAIDQCEDDRKIVNEILLLH
mgnify:CR=1 FL=1